MGFVRKLTGADHAEKAADHQIRAADKGFALQERALDLADKNTQTSLANFKPFLDAGTNAINPYMDFSSNRDNQVNFLNNDPVFKAASDRVISSTKNKQASMGKLNSTDTQGRLHESLLASGEGFINNRLNQLYQPIGIGMNAAAQTGGVLHNQNMVTGNILDNQTNLLGNKGNAFAAKEGVKANSTGKLFNAVTGGMFGGGSKDRSGSDMLKTGLALFAASDIRLKENIKKVGRLDSGLNVYQYNYKGHPQTTIGVMAQEVEQVNPSAVKEINGFKHVNYGAL